MTNGRSRWMLAATALAVLVAGGSIDAVAKKRSSKKVFTATIDGKRLKPTPRSIGLNAGGGTIAFFATGSKIARGLGGTSRSASISCVNDLSTKTFPYTTTDCLANYTETRVRPLSFKIWQHIQTGATEVTFDAYEPGVYIQGRFHAVVPAGPSNPDLAPVTLDGEFRGRVELADPSR